VRAVVIARPGGPEVLELRDVPAPEPSGAQLRVRVHATAVNRADLLQRRGAYPAPAGAPADIPGLEYAGTVDAVGPAASGWRIGERVMGLVGGGGYAEAVVVDEGEALPVPAGLSLEQAAAVPEAFLTAHDALVTQARLKAGEVVLIHGVGSGVGTAALQLAAVRGARVIGTSRSAWKLERAVELGLHDAIDTGREDFAHAVLRLTDGHGADVVLDLVGGDYLRGNLDALAGRGRIAVVGLVAGATATLDMRTLMGKRAHIFGTVMRTRPLREKVAVAAAFRDDALHHFDTGRLRPVIDDVLPMGEAAAAHARLEANENFGKIVLRW
jgi:NADPH2:quinone reductase